MADLTISETEPESEILALLGDKERFIESEALEIARYLGQQSMRPA